MRRSPPRQRIDQYATEHDIELILLDPPALFDAAIRGLVYGFGQELAVLYDQQRILAAMQRAGMSVEDAEEYFEFNTVGAYLGEATPRFLIRV